MSSVPSPVEGVSPFVPVTTPTIERANHLMSLREHPGFVDLIRISQEIVKEAEDICGNYGGWDEKQITALQIQMRVARTHHQRLLSKMAEAIEQGIQEAQNQIPTIPVKSAEEAVDQGDYVRQRVLEKFQENDNRAAGSY